MLLGEHRRGGRQVLPLQNILRLRLSSRRVARVHESPTRRICTSRMHKHELRRGLNLSAKERLISELAVPLPFSPYGFSRRSGSTSFSRLGFAPAVTTAKAFPLLPKSASPVRGMGELGAGCSPRRNARERNGRSAWRENLLCCTSPSSLRSIRAWASLGRCRPEGGNE